MGPQNILLLAVTEKLIQKYFLPRHHSSIHLRGWRMSATLGFLDRGVLRVEEQRRSAG